MEARGISLQDNFTVHRDAKFYSSWASCDTIPWEQPCSPTNMLCVAMAIMGPYLGSFWEMVAAFVTCYRPIVAMFCTSLCIGSPLAINQSRILSSEGIQLILPILAFHTAAFTFGYWLSKIPLWRQGEAACKTISLCTGMQSSTLAGLLATQFLGSSHAVPPACSVVAMAIMGLYLGSFWGNGGRIRDMLLPFLPRIPDSGHTA